MKEKVFAILLICALLTGCGTETAPPLDPASVSADILASDTEKTEAPAESTSVPAAKLQERLQQAILGFCEMMFGSMRYDSTTAFGWDDFDSIEGYMVAKYCESRREFYKIDNADITDVRVLSVELQGESLKQEDSRIQCAIVSYEYIGGGVESKCLTRYFFTLREENGSFRVTDLTTYNSKYSIADTDDVDIAVLRESLDSWKEECKDAGDKWQFEAVDRIMEQKKVPIDDLIPEEMKEEMRRRSQKTSEDAAAEDIRANEAYDLPEEAMGAGMTFREGDSVFWVSFTYLDCYDVFFSDNSIKTVGEALEMGLIGMAELDRFGIPYTAEGVETPAEAETKAPAETTQERETERATETEATKEASTESSETEKETRKTGASGYYSDEDIELAKVAVRSWMRDFFEGSQIKELYYPGDDFTDDYKADSLAGGGAFQSTDNNMVLGGYFLESDGTQRGYAGSSHWVWILRRSSDGWEVIDAGYC